MALLTIPNALTLLNLLAGTVSIWATFQGLESAAALLLILAVILDGLDGRVAKMLGSTSLLGGALDALADAVSFAVAPFVIAVHTAPGSIPLLIAGCIFVSCGVLRLARFQASPKHEDFFEGMPITVNGILFPLLSFLDASERGFLIALIVSGALMISRIAFSRLL